MSVNVFIPCLPPAGTAQQKGVMVINGKPHFFKKAKLKQAESTLLALMQPHAPPAPLAGPLSVVLTFVLPWRATEKKSVLRGFQSVPCAVRPDVENRAKLAIDVMTTLRFWHDDAQISTLKLSKHYGDTPGIGICVTADLGAYPREL